MDEFIYYVDQNDTPTGKVSEKYAAHHHDTQLHAAFSVYVFDEKGRFLVTKRASSKKVWPDVWTNSCCGHPFPDETREDAIIRRLDYELGMKVRDIQQIISDYTYKTPPYKGIIEHEYCPVYIAIVDSSVTPNPDEVEEYKWMSWEDFIVDAKTDGDDYSDPQADDAPKWSWWCKDQLKQLQENNEFKQFLDKVIS